MGPVAEKACKGERMDVRKIQWLYALRSLLQYHQVLGIEDYPAGETVAGFLAAVDLPFSPPQVPVVSAKAVASPYAAGETAEKPTVEIFADIAGEVRSCTDCVLHTRRLFSVPGRGGKRVKLLIVGGWLSQERGDLLPADSIFGVEEDRMVSRMLAAMGLPPDAAFITNVIKCAVDDDCRPTSEDIHICFSFLQRQVQQLDPAVICTMGIVATRAVLKKNQPLSQLRGKWYSYTVSEGKTIPVVPTYDPTFLLKNPEFKKATWEDLQVIAKHLRTATGLSTEHG